MSILSVSRNGDEPGVGGRCYGLVLIEDNIDFMR